MLFKNAENLFTSLGFNPMTDTFWKNSIIVKPTDGRPFQCHGSAFNFFNGFDYRIKMCTQVTDNYYSVVHHEMGHIQYFMSYIQQPFIFQNGANSGFHEAIGDTIALSASTPTHFKTIGLLNDFNASHQFEINFLMKEALKKFAFIPYAYLIDKWRWNVFRGLITPQNYNEKWWEFIKNFQGIEPPMNRNESFFDPGAKFHIPAYVPYNSYFIATFLQFQFYESLCRYARHTGPLYLCDFYGSKNAGKKFEDMMKLGASKHWSHALKSLTNSDRIDPSAILTYFKPLMQWLVKENARFPDDPVDW